MTAKTKTISHEGLPIKSLLQVFDVERKGNIIYFHSIDTKQPLRLNMQYSITNNGLNRKFDLSSQSSATIHRYLVALYHALVRIQEQTGYRLKLSEADNEEPLLLKLNEAIRPALNHRI